MNEPHVPNCSRPGIPLGLPDGAPSEESRRTTQDGSLSRELVEFMAEEIGSIEQLEILLHLFRNRDRWWTASEVYDVVKSSLASVQERLKHFASTDILEDNESESQSYRFNSSNQRRLRVVEELDAQYRERRVRMVELIYSQLRSGASEFARAFRIRKDD